MLVFVAALLTANAIFFAKEEKGERLAKLVVRRRTLLVLDGLEPLQNPPGLQEGRVTLGITGGSGSRKE